MRLFFLCWPYLFNLLALTVLLLETLMAVLGTLNHDDYYFDSLECPWRLLL